jgi:hypothetical protein
MQTGVPVLQAIVPRLHGLPGTLQVMLATHAPQVPVALHTMSVPHPLPAATLVFASMQVGADPEQTSVPLWHRFVGWHGEPIWQVAQLPAWQTIPVPQAVPFGLLSDSVQTGAPVVQTMLPTRHGLPVTSQAIPSVHAPQVPLRQTMSIPQTVPFACMSVSSMQVIAPSLQTNMPLWQGLAGTQAPPATQLVTGTSTLPESMNTTSLGPPSVLPMLPPAPPPELPPAPAELPALPVGPASRLPSGRRRKPPHPATATSTTTVRERLSSIRATS